MSVSIILIPLALAAVSIATADRSGGSEVTCQVNTRMRNPQLLGAALEDLGATVGDRTGGEITFTYEGNASRMLHNESGIWSAHFHESFDLDEGLELVKMIDAAYGARLQTEVLSRLRERAPAAGLKVESETREEDSSVVMMLSVQNGAQR